MLSFVPGTINLVLQISLVELGRIFLGVIEVLYIWKDNWTFGEMLCPIYFGTEVVLNSVNLYLSVLINFHAISTWKIQKKFLLKNNKNPLTQQISTECLVIENEKRNIFIDYNRKKLSLSVILPCLTVWFCCLSLSVPNFSFATVVDNYDNKTLCTVVDFNFGYLIRYLFVIFRDIIPIPLLVILIFINSVTFCNLECIKKTSLQKYSELKNLIILSLQMAFLYLIFSFQRDLFYFLHNIYMYTNSIDDNFKFAPLENLFISRVANFLSAILYYSVILIKPILCIVAMPTISDRIANCFVKKDKK